jgi:hypothetical protein
MSSLGESGNRSAMVGILSERRRGKPAVADSGGRLEPGDNQLTVIRAINRTTDARGNEAISSDFSTT